MQASRIVLALVIAMLTIGSGAAAAAITGPGDLHHPVFTSPHKVVEKFLKAVDRGELKVFTHTLTRKMVVPLRVDYSYDLAGSDPVIRVHAKLRQSIPMPGNGGNKIRAVSCIVSADGHILETEIHAWGE